MSKVPQSGRAAVNRIRQLTARNPPSARPVSSTTPNESQQNISGNETLNRNRRVVWTAGIAVIAAAGAILGAQLKTWDESKEQIPDHSVVSVSSSISSSQAASSEQRPSTLPTKLAPSDSTIAQQIAALEATKGGLQYQKAKLQEKIDRVRERKQQKEEMEAKRKINVNR